MLINNNIGLLPYNIYYRLSSLYHACGFNFPLRISERAFPGMNAGILLRLLHQPLRVQHTPHTVADFRGVFQGPDLLYFKDLHGQAVGGFRNEYDVRLRVCESPDVSHQRFSVPQRDFEREFRPDGFCQGILHLLNRYGLFFCHNNAISAFPVPARKRRF